MERVEQIFSVLAALAFIFITTSLVRGAQPGQVTQKVSDPIRIIIIKLSGTQNTQLELFRDTLQKSEIVDVIKIEKELFHQKKSLEREEILNFHKLGAELLITVELFEDAMTLKAFNPNNGQMVIGKKYSGQIGMGEIVFREFAKEVVNYSKEVRIMPMVASNNIAQKEKEATNKESPDVTHEKALLPRDIGVGRIAVSSGKLLYNLSLVGSYIVPVMVEEFADVNIKLATAQYRDGDISVAFSSSNNNALGILIHNLTAQDLIVHWGDDKRKLSVGDYIMVLIALMPRLYHPISGGELTRLEDDFTIKPSKSIFVGLTGIDLILDQGFQVRQALLPEEETKARKLIGKSITITLPMTVRGKKTMKSLILVIKDVSEMK